MIINQPFLGAVNTGRSAGGLKAIRTTATAPVISLAARLRRVLRPNIVTAATPKYGCLMAMIPSLETVIPNWAAANIPADTLAADGIETETHCTVLYGFHLDFESRKLIEAVGGRGAITLKLGKLSRFECPDYDVIKFTVQSPAITAFHHRLNRLFKGQIKPSEYTFNPHVTVAYVKKGTNQNLDASAIEGQTVIVQQLLYSLPEKQGRIVIDLVPRSDVTGDQKSNPYQANECPFCGEFAVSSCRCIGPHDEGDLKKGHGLKCSNGHRWSKGIGYDPATDTFKIDGTTHQPTGETHVDHPHAHLTNRIRNVIKAAHIKEYTKVVDGKTVTVHEHDTSTESVFKHTMEEPAWGKIADIDAGKKKFTIREISLDKLTPTQHRLDPDKVEHFKKHGHPDMPELIRHKGKLLIHEGHHRLAGAIARGDKKHVVKIYATDHSGESADMVQAAESDHPHDVIRRAAAARYQAAMDEFTTHAKADALAAKKRKRTELAALFLLLMADAGEEAYALTYPRLDALVQRGMGSVLPPDQIKVEAESFVAKRAEFLREFPNTVADRLAAAKEQAEADADDGDEKAVRQAVNKAADAIKDGIGTRVADTEAQATYGAAQVEVLRRAGFTTAIWNQYERPTKRDTHAINMEMGPQPLGTLYPNGQRYPGDPAGGPGECINCLCYLEGVSREGPVQATHVAEYTRTTPTGKTVTVHEHEDIRKELVAKGIATNKEHLILTHHGKRIQEHEGSHSHVEIERHEPASDVEVHHNHPDNSGPSHEDVRSLAHWPSLSKVHAYTHSGETHTVEPIADKDKIYRRSKELAEKLSDRMHDYSDKLTGPVTPETRAAYYKHRIEETHKDILQMHAEGLIKYTHHKPA